MTDLYRYIPVWRRESNGLVLYRVFEVLGRGYAVQSKDFYRVDSLDDPAPALEAQFLELLSEQAPDGRSGISPTIEAAVIAFDRSFGESAGS